MTGSNPVFATNKHNINLNIGDTDMNYQIFDEMYNTRDCNGVIVRASIINYDGDVIFEGSIDKINDFMDTKCDVIRINGSLDYIYNQEMVINTNIAGNYAKHIFDKLNFNL